MTIRLLTKVFPVGRIRKNIALAFGSGFLGLVTLDSLVWVGVFEVTEVEKYARAASHQGIVFDARDRLTVLDGLRAREGSISPIFFPSAARSSALKSGNEDIYPLGGPSNRDVLYCNETGEYVVYRTDPLGFRNPPELTQRRNLDVLIVGNSFAEGACVP